MDSIDNMKIRIINLLWLILPLLLTGCPKSLMVKESGESVSCIQAYQADADHFVAIASGANLEMAKTNARRDIAQQISSTISSRMDRKRKLQGEKFSETTEEHVRSETNAIPIDQHQIDDVCQSGKTYYARASLSKQALISSTKTRLSFHKSEVQRKLKKASGAGLYGRYQIKSSLSENIKHLRTLVVLLEQYAPNENLKPFNSSLQKAERFVADNQEIRIAVGSSEVTDSLLPIIERALSKAQLKYTRNNKNAAALVLLDAKLSKKKLKDHYVAQIKADLFVRSNDDNELLSRVALKEQTSLSTVGYHIATKDALRKLHIHLTQRLSGSREYLLKTLGFDDNAK